MRRVWIIFRLLYGRRILKGDDFQSMKSPNIISLNTASYAWPHMTQFDWMSTRIDVHKSGWMFQCIRSSYQTRMNDRVNKSNSYLYFSSVLLLTHWLAQHRLHQSSWPHISKTNIKRKQSLTIEENNTFESSPDINELILQKSWF